MVETSYTPGTTRFADRIRAIMRERGITNKALATTLGVKPRRLSHWVGGRAEPSLVYVRQIATELEVSIDELVAATEHDYQVEKSWRRVRDGMENWVRASALNLRYPEASNG